MQIPVKVAQFSLTVNSLTMLSIFFFRLCRMDLSNYRLHHIFNYGWLMYETKRALMIDEFTCHFLS